MAVQQYPQVAALDSLDEKQHRRELANVLNLVAKGRINCVVEVTLGGTDSTLVIDDRIHSDCLLIFDPLNQVAEQAIRTGPFRVNEVDRQTGRFTITHSASVSGAKFKVAILA